jgi:hypothetical protein
LQLSLTVVVGMVVLVLVVVSLSLLRLGPMVRFGLDNNHELWLILLKTKTYKLKNIRLDTCVNVVDILDEYYDTPDGIQPKREIKAQLLNYIGHVKDFVIPK